LPTLDIGLPQQRFWQFHSLPYLGVSDNGVTEEVIFIIGIVLN
jgi:hypothetical protein